MNPLSLICYLFLFGSNIETGYSCFYSSTKKNEGSRSVVFKLKNLFGRKELAKEKNIITYNFIKDGCNEKNMGENKNKENNTGFEVTHVNRLIYINNFKTFILSAYIPYIYMSVRDIYIVLKKIKELNFNTVYTFLFWPENEYMEDAYDITKSKLFYLLNFCASNGLFVILDIGPYINNIYNANIPTYILFNKNLNEYIKNVYVEKKKKKNKLTKRIGKFIRFDIWNNGKRSINEFDENVKRVNIEQEIHKKKVIYNKSEESFNTVYSLYYFKRVIKWFNYIFPHLKKFTNINNGPIIYVNIDKTFDNYYMYVIIDLKRRKYFQNICNVDSYFKNSTSSSGSSSRTSGSSSICTSFLNCIINFFKRVRRSYILTLGYLLYVRFNKYMRILNEYELGLIYINEIYKIVQKHFQKINTLTTNYPFIKNEFISSYAGDNCYNHFFHNNWFDNECIQLNKPCIWSQVWTGAKYSIHNVNSGSILKRHFQDPIVYDSSPSNVSPVSELLDIDNKQFKRYPSRPCEESTPTGEPAGSDSAGSCSNGSCSNGSCSNGSDFANAGFVKGNDKKAAGKTAEQEAHSSEKAPTDGIRVGVKRIKSSRYSKNNYIGHIRNFKDLTFNILVFIAKGGVFLNIFPFYSGNNINNTHTYLEHYSKETGQPLDVYFNQKEPLYSHIKKLFKFLYKYGHYLLKNEDYIRPVKISKNIEMYNYDAIKIICNHNLKGGTYVKVGPLNYNINSFSCIIYNEHKKKIIYDSSFNYSYEISFVKKKEVYSPIDKYLYSLNAATLGPIMCLKEDKNKYIKNSTRGKLLSRNIIKHMNIFSNFFATSYIHSVHEINVLNHFYVTLDFTKFQWYIIKLKEELNYVKLFLSNYSLYVYVYADNKFIYSGFNEYKYIEIINARNIYIICVNLGLGFPKQNIRTDFLNHINLNDLKNDYFFIQDQASQNEMKKKGLHTNLSQQNSYLTFNAHTGKKKKKNIEENGDRNGEINGGKNGERNGEKMNGDKSSRRNGENKQENNSEQNEKKKKKIMNESGDELQTSGLNKGNKNFAKKEVREETNRGTESEEGKYGNKNTSRKHGYIFEDLSYDMNISLKMWNNRNAHDSSMYDENARNVHNYYDAESTNTFIFIVTRNEYDLFNCVGLHGEIIKNEKNVEIYKKLYNMFDYNDIKPHLMNKVENRQNDERDDVSKNVSDKWDHNNVNFESLMDNKKTNMKSITNSFLKMCSSGFFSFFFNKIKYYCKTGIFKHLNKFSKVNENNINSPLTWYTLLYFIKNVDYIRSKYSLKLSVYDEKLKEIDGLSRGFVYINNHMLGSFWVTDDKESYENEINEEQKLKKKKKMKKEKKKKILTNENLISIPLTRYMRIPTDWLIEGTNVIIVFDEFGGNPYKVEIIREVLQGGVYRLTKKEKYVNWFLFLFILSIIIFITYFFFKAVHNYFKAREEKERNKQNYRNIIENIITHNIYVNSSYSDATEDTESENIQNVSEFLDS
ncbi:hypothetical protein, conserved [Plasmodium gonderi]|uniref:Glycoside hydrolase 35 catalytic domain-containing protein n=1 Tax=Plasmodium gonderi TaxID=77519 RepID=A0A1Y1JNT2_PLAGO|nr:hypothetical protein, conserved [Plasmodium gonderi]GAW82063.1 hypothetical protein, conserved [Plasmodium gonderi]